MRQGRRWCIHYWASWETQLGNTVSLKSPYGTSTAQDSLGGRKGVEFICWHFLSPDVTGSGLFQGAWTPLHSGLCCQGGCDRQLGSPCSERLRPDIEWGEEGRAYMAQWIWGGLLVIPGGGSSCWQPQREMMMVVRKEQNHRNSPKQYENNPKRENGSVKCKLIVMESIFRWGRLVQDARKRGEERFSNRDAASLWFQSTYTVTGF